jgi:hypothetical protein
MTDVDARIEEGLREQHAEFAAALRDELTAVELVEMTNRYPDEVVPVEAGGYEVCLSLWLPNAGSPEEALELAMRFRDRVEVDEVTDRELGWWHLHTPDGC